MQINEPRQRLIIQKMARIPIERLIFSPHPNDTNDLNMFKVILVGKDGNEYGSISAKREDEDSDVVFDPDSFIIKWERVINDHKQEIINDIKQSSEILGLFDFDLTPIELYKVKIKRLVNNSIHHPVIASIMYVNYKWHCNIQNNSHKDQTKTSSTESDEDNVIELDFVLKDKIKATLQQALPIPISDIQAKKTAAFNIYKIDFLGARSIYGHVEITIKDDNDVIYIMDTLQLFWNIVIRENETSIQRAMEKQHKDFGLFDTQLIPLYNNNLKVMDITTSYLIANIAILYQNHNWVIHAKFYDQNNRGELGIDENEIAKERANNSSNTSTSGAIKNREAKLQRMLGVAMKELSQMHEKSEETKLKIKDKELQYNSLIDARNKVFKLKLTCIFMTALGVALYTNNIDTTGLMIGLLLGLVWGGKN